MSISVIVNEDSWSAALFPIVLYPELVMPFHSNNFISMHIVVYQTHQFTMLYAIIICICIQLSNVAIVVDAFKMAWIGLE